MSYNETMVASKTTTQQLNTLLADLQVYYQNLRGYHWNIKGRHFFSLHEKFEALYLDAAEKADDVAERILTLGDRPYHTLTEFIAHANLETQADISDGAEAVASLLSDIDHLLASFRSLLSTAGENEDEGTTALMSDFIREFEKTRWMFRSWKS
ncbi:Dps family protein [Roseivirga sp. BDSF3-8]|uniref:Dps family protein n=1 Tax=Roseivirga sp. BDSF3-8 TaxID=3241598 RepID=UPI0035321776